ncbi:MAG: hypothetical protein PHO72_11750 [Sphaerochaeta sp.]|nr:hypothetical protein [Sphaerochaeta sp.]
MRLVMRVFARMMQEILHDSMLVAVCFASLLAAFAFRFGIPTLEDFLCLTFHQESIISPYYQLIDLMLIQLTPYMFCFAPAMVMLDEYDQNITSALAVTPLGLSGYLFSHLLMPAILASIISLVLITIFSLTSWPMSTLIILCIISGSTGLLAAMTIFSFSHNKLEGMAMGKLSGLLLMGLPIPYLMDTPLMYGFSLFPSFWMALYAQTQNRFFALLSLGTAYLIMPLLYARVQRKLS